MKIAFASLVGVEPMPFPTLLARAEAAGLDAIEVNVGPTFPRIAGAAYPGHLDLDAILRDGPGQTHELLTVYGVTITSLAPMLNLLAPEATRREERIAVFRQAIDACAALGVPTVVTYGGSAFGMHFSGLPGVGPDHPSNHCAENVALFREVFTPLAQYAEAKGVRIAFETAARGGGQGNIAHSPELWDMLFDAVPSPALGLSFDPSHLIWLQIPNIPDLIRQYGSRIYHFDAKDTEILPAVLARQGILGSGWWRYRLPGLGALDWRAILSALCDIGYDDVISIENEDPLFLGLDGVAWSADYLRGIFPSHKDATKGE
ncbi:MAG: sugar phosphate isomerase/epimerase [Chloroflexota bacterium]|nr:sugar phosphate isomerase/epimerase [Chloroflexota bacterium]